MSIFELDRVIAIHFDHIFAALCRKLNSSQKQVGDIFQTTTTSSQDSKEHVEWKTEAGNPPRNKYEQNQPEQKVAQILSSHLDSIQFKFKWETNASYF